jgi:hypothetical protein
MQKMQDKETFEGAKQYLQSFFRKTQISESEMLQKQAFIQPIISWWKQEDAIRLFYEVLFWAVDLPADWKNNCFQAVVTGVDSGNYCMIKLRKEPTVRIFDRYIFFDPDLWDWDNLGGLEFKTELSGEEYAPLILFDCFFWQLGVSRKSFGGLWFYAPYEDCIDVRGEQIPHPHEFIDGSTIDQYTGDPDMFLTQIPYLRNEQKKLFKGQKCFLRAIRYFFRVFYPHNIPSLKQIKRVMLKHNLPNPFLTFWVK